MRCLLQQGGGWGPCRSIVPVFTATWVCSPSCALITRLYHHLCKFKLSRWYLVYIFFYLLYVFRPNSLIFEHFNPFHERYMAVI